MDVTVNKCSQEITMSKQLVVKEDNTKKKLGKAYHYISLRTAGIKLAGSAGKSRMYFPTMFCKNPNKT